MTATKPCGCGPDAPCPAHLGDDSPTEAQQGAREALLALAAELEDEAAKANRARAVGFDRFAVVALHDAAKRARARAAALASGPGSTGAGSSDTGAAGERTRALRAAAEAVRGCNVRWDGMIDDPEIVAGAALAAVKPVIRDWHREAVNRERERRARAVDLLSRALSLRTAEGYPGISAEWGKWDRDCETYLRSLAPGGQP